MKLSILFPEVSNVERAIQRIIRLEELGCVPLCLEWNDLAVLPLQVIAGRPRAWLPVG